MSRILNPKEVMKRTSLSRTTITRLERKGDFPVRLVVSPIRVGWYENEVEEWIEKRPRSGLCVEVT